MTADRDETGNGRRFRFTTANSTYEVDGLRIRRLRGASDPTPSQGSDGCWKKAVAIGPAILGYGVAIMWRIDQADGAAVLRQTHTSAVTAVERVGQDPRV